MNGAKGNKSFLVFLGDYGDRGSRSPEVYHMVLSLKLNFPDRIVLLRGNHEGPPDLPFEPHDLPFRLGSRFGEQGPDIYEAITKMWEEMPLVAAVKNRYLLLHGGLPTELTEADELAKARELHPLKPHLTEIPWNDPSDEVERSSPSPRGCGKLFGQSVTLKVLRMTGTTVVIRGHEVVDGGTRVNHGGKVLTVFSCKEPLGLSEAAFLRLNLAEMPHDAYGLAEAALRFQPVRGPLNVIEKDDQRTLANGTIGGVQAYGSTSTVKPPGLRLYHYTRAANVDLILLGGLKPPVFLWDTLKAAVKNGTIMLGTGPNCDCHYGS